MLTYLEQIETEAAKAGVDVERACQSAGIAKTTLQRWRRGEVSPREATAQAVIEQIHTMAQPERAA